MWFYVPCYPNIVNEILVEYSGWSSPFSSMLSRKNKDKSIGVVGKYVKKEAPEIPSECCLGIQLNCYLSIYVISSPQRVDSGREQEQSKAKPPLL